MPKFIDYTGRKIGRVAILLNIERGKNSRWFCRCDCGLEFQCLSQSFKRGKMFECKSCLLERRRGVDLTGRKYGRWTVLGRELDKRNHTIWRTRCDCGAMGRVATCNLGKRGKSLSCGCLGRKEKSRYANETLYPPLHHTSTTHLYAIRTRIIHSCYKQIHMAYKNFGGCGYSVCELWRNSARDFYKWCMDNGWDRGHVVAIKDGEKKFCPENCYVVHERKYIGLKLQKRVTHNGETKTLREWANEASVGYRAIGWRLRKGYPIEEAIFAKPRQRSGKRKVFPDDEIKRLYNTGLSMAEVGRLLKYSYAAIGRRLRKMDINPDLKGRRKYKDKLCVVCHSYFIPTNSNHKRCSNCPKSRA